MEEGINRERDNQGLAHYCGPTSRLHYTSTASPLFHHRHSLPLDCHSLLHQFSPMPYGGMGVLIMQPDGSETGLAARNNRKQNLILSLSSWALLTGDSTKGFMRI